jgi:toxin-antitoxin system PIN domain toxin
MARTPDSARKSVPGMHLLDGNVLHALIDEAHIHHAPTRHWFSHSSTSFATCPITQGTLLRLVMRLGGQGIEQALALLDVVTAHPRHHFWPDVIPYQRVQWQGVMGYRQVTDAYLAGIARHHQGKLVSFDRGLLALHPDVGVAVEG